MAMNVNFLKGLYSKYEGLASKDSNTFYLTYESGTNEAMGGAIRLFLGAEELTNKVDIAALREYIGTLPEGATSEDIVSYISEAITAKIGTLKIGDTSYDTVVDYVIAKTTGIATDSVVQGKADKVVPAKVNNIAVLTADGNLSDGGKTIAEVEQVAKDYTDAEITGLELVLSEDGKTLNLNNKAGTAVATLDTTSFIKDGMIKSVELVDADGDGKEGKFLKITWNIDDANETDADSDLDVVYVDVTTLVDVYVGEEGITVTSDYKVKHTNILTEAGSTTASSGAVGYEGSITLPVINYDKNGHITSVSTTTVTLPKAVDISGKEDKDNLKALAYKATINDADLIDTEIITKGKLEKSVQTSLGKADTAVQSVATGSTNGTVKVDGTDVAVFGLGSAAYTSSDAYDAKDTAKNLIGTQQTEETAATGVYAAIQGATTNTVRQCVDAINAMNNQTGVVIGTVENIVTQLTWGSF